MRTICVSLDALQFCSTVRVRLGNDLVLASQQKLELFRIFVTFCKNTGLGGIDISSFEGICIENMLSLETMFNIKVVVFESGGANISNVVWVSASKSGNKKVLYLHLNNDHFSFIKNIENYAKALRVRHAKPHILAQITS